MPLVTGQRGRIRRENSRGFFEPEKRGLQFPGRVEWQCLEVTRPQGYASQDPATWFPVLAKQLYPTGDPEWRWDF